MASGKYVLLGIISSHSKTKSPPMWKALLKEMGLEGDYVIWDMGAYNADRLKGAETLKKKLDELRANKNFYGCNVTVDWKEPLVELELLDGLDPIASKTGAVNTIKKVGGRLEGYNTDGYGLIGSLKENGVEVKDRYVVITGAGGATGPIVAALAEQGAKRIAIHNRTRERAVKMAERLRGISDTEIYGGGLNKSEEDIHEIESSLVNANIVINTTELGMLSDRDPENVRKTTLTKEQMSLTKEGCVFMDIVYNPLMTKFLQQASELGYKIVHGDGMLLWQAVRAAEIILDIKPSARYVAAMRNSLKS